MNTPLPGAACLKDTPTPSLGPWRSRAPLPTPRSSLSSAVANDRIFAIESQESLQRIPNTPHQVPQTSAGRAALVQVLLAGS